MRTDAAGILAELKEDEKATVFSLSGYRCTSFSRTNEYRELLGSN